MALDRYMALYTKLEEHYTVVDMTGEEKVATEALSTHVRYYVPLTVEEYTYMVDLTTQPLWRSTVSLRALLGMFG